MTTDQLIERHYASAVSLRHRFHQIPELNYVEHKTAALIRETLDALGVQCVAGVKDASTATIAHIGDLSKPCVALRADIDALPIVEATGLPYASTHAGCMHACGHDGHMSTLLGTIAALKSIENDLKVCVKFMFQPAEENGAGAERLVKAGVLDGRIGPKAIAVFGQHGWPGLKVGTVATRPGPLLAATSMFKATFIGRGCHGAYPHLGADPITAAAEAVTSLQKVVSREFDPTDSAVITIGMIRGGTATNIIPDNAVIEATVRGLNPEAMRKLRASIERRCTGIATANDCKLDFFWESGYPATINDPAMADYVAKIAKQALGQNGFIPAATPSMGGEDFAYYLQQVPGCFFLTGTCPANTKCHPSLHNDHYDFTDEALKVGMRMFVEVVRNYEPTK